MFVAGRSFRLLLRDSEVTFWRDSLYAVGGSLTVACQGYLSPVENINNCFQIDTDSTLNDSTKIPDLLILIDRDPPNALFSDSLGTDRNRAIAWAEAAGTLDITHCHNPYNPLWNHYWDTRISGADTCSDTHMPCENAIGVDTGVMQIYRQWKPQSSTDTSGWALHFARSNSKPSGYIQVMWDSLAWNWAICIYNGKYIHDVYMPSRFTSAQKLFPDSCSYANCDTFPLNANKEDLKSYGYHRGDPEMKSITTINWNEMVADTTDPISDGAQYVQRVRLFKYTKPWE